MTSFQICMCGAAPGYPHAAYCPYPCFWTDERSCREWERARDDIGRPTRIPETLDPPTAAGGDHDRRDP